MVFVLLFFLVFGCSFSAAMPLSAGYDYSWGSHGYHSNFLYGTIVHNFNDRTSFQGTLSFFNDTYYDVIVPVMLRGKYEIVSDLRLGGILSAAYGGLAESDGIYTSNTFGVFLEKNLTDALTAKLGYKRVNGYIHTPGGTVVAADMGMNGGNNRWRRAGPLSVYGVSGSVSSSDIFNVQLGVDFDEYAGGLSSIVEYTYENRTGDVTLNSYGLELFYPIGKKLYLTNGIVLTGAGGAVNEKYFTVGISRVF